MTCTRCFHYIPKVRIDRECTYSGCVGSDTPRCGCFHGSAVLKESELAHEQG